MQLLDTGCFLGIISNYTGSKAYCFYINFRDGSRLEKNDIKRSMLSANDVKHNADVISDEISADDIGVFTDGNAAESLQHGHRLILLMQNLLVPCLVLMIKKLNHLNYQYLIKEL